MDEQFDKNKLRAVQADIVENYKAHLDPDSDRSVSSYRYLVFSNIYDGKYKGRLSSSLGYAQEYQQAKPFLNLINRLALTHANLFNLFTEAWESGSEDPVGTLLNLFNNINKNSYTDLDGIIRDDISKLAEKISANKSTQAKEKVAAFIEKVVKYKVASPKGDTKYDDYFEIKNYVNSTLRADRELASSLSFKDVLEIKSLREKLRNKEKKVSNKIRTLKIAINQYLLSLNESGLAETRRIRLLKDQAIFAAKYDNNGEWTDELMQQKKETRQQKSLHQQVATTVGANLGFGEGVVAGVAMYSFLAGIAVTMPAAVALGVLTGIAGAICNYYLVRDDTYNILNEIRVNNFFNELTGVKKDIAIMLGSGSLATGFVYGALSAMQLFNGLLMPLFSSIHLPTAAATLLGLSISCLPVAFTAIGIASIFFFVIADFIKNSRWQTIKSYFYRHYIDLGWSEMSPSEVIKAVMGCIGQTLKLTLGLGINLLITFVSFGVFHTQGVKLLSFFINSTLASSLSSFLSATNGLISLLFGIEKVNEFLEPITLNSALAWSILLVPYYLPKMAYVSLSLVLDMICNLPYAIAYLAASAPAITVNLISYVVQFATNGVSTLITSLLDAPKMLINLTPAILALSFLLAGGLTNLVRAPLSLIARLVEYAIKKFSGGSVNIDVLHQTVDSLFNSLAGVFQYIATGLFSMVASIHQHVELSSVKHYINSKTSAALNQLADMRQAINMVLSTIRSTALVYTTKFHDFLTAFNVCATIFEFFIEPIKRKLYTALEIDCAENNKTENQLNKVQQSVSNLGGTTIFFAKSSAGLNGVGQGALMANDPGPVSAVLALVGQTVLSTGPNIIAAEDSLSKEFAINAATRKTSETGVERPPETNAEELELRLSVAGG